MTCIDVWMPIRNAAATLPRALASLKRQTFRDWRLVAVDDGSTDDSAEIVENHGHPVMRRAHGGIVAALRACAAASDATLVARMDADDVAHRDRLAAQVRVDADVVGTRVRTTGEAMRTYVRWQNSLVTHDEIVRDLFVESPLAHPSVMFRREAYDRAGGYQAADWPEDYDLWMRMWRSGARFAKVPRVLLTWSDRATRLTRTHRMYREEAYFDIKRHYVFGHPALRSPVTVWGAGPIGRWWVGALEAGGVEVEQAIDIDPRKVGRRLRDRIPVRSPEDALARRRGSVLGAVGSRGARTLIRRALVQAGLVEGREFLFVA